MTFSRAYRSTKQSNRRTQFEKLEARNLLTAVVSADGSEGGFIEVHEDDHAHAEIGVSPFGDLIPDGGAIVTARKAESDPAAAATTNLKITSIRLIDTDFNEVVSPIQGQLLRMQVFFESFNLPNDVQYTIHFSVDGDTINNGQIGLGAGAAVANWFWWRNGFYATGNSHTLTITLDGDNQVAESNEADNALSLTFSTDATTTPSSKLAFPVTETEDRLVQWINYVDVDATETHHDYTGGTYTYDQHRGWDLMVANFHEQDRGVEIVASLGGTVSAAHDGEFDRETEGFDITPTPVGNHVIVDHGGGWQTWYWHFRRDSVRVKVGDTVEQGEVLGLMGSSGISSGAHLHFEVRYRGLPIESAINMASYFSDPRGYVSGSRQVYMTGLSDYWPFDHTKELASEIHDWKSNRQDFIYAYMAISGIEQGDIWQVRYRRPDNTIDSTWNFNIPRSYVFSNWYYRRRLPINPPLGDWTVEYLINGDVVSTETLTVSATGGPELRVVDFANDIYINDRVTPVDFGQAPQGSLPLTRSFTLQNHGHDTLNIMDVEAPEGFTHVLSGPTFQPFTIAPGLSANLTFRLETDVPGFYNGQIRILNDDADESEMRFTVEGWVQGITPDSQIRLGFDRTVEGESQTVLGKVYRYGDPGDTSSAVEVQLVSDDPATVTVPTSVTIPAGETEVAFPVTLGTGSTVETRQIAVITATNTSGDKSIASIDVLTTPKIVSITVNDGAVQRSKLEEVVVAFDRPVEVETGGTSPFVVVDSDQTFVTNNWDYVAPNDNTTIRIVLPANLADDNYRLQIDGDQLSTNSLKFDGDQDTLPGGVRVFGNEAADLFFSFLGDHDGDRDVDVADLGNFGLTFRSKLGDSNYDSLLDFDDDEDVDVADLSTFASRFRTSLGF